MTQPKKKRIGRPRTRAVPKRKFRRGPAELGKINPNGFFNPQNPYAREFRAKCGLAPLTGHEGEVTCLRCETKFDSEDRRKFRVCDRCKGKQEWREGGGMSDAELYAVGRSAPPQAVEYRTGDRGKAHRARLKSLDRNRISGRFKKHEES